MSFEFDRVFTGSLWQDLISEVVAAGEDARAMQHAIRQGSFERKSDDSPVTEADRAVERRLRAFTETRFPAAGFFGEETGESGAGPLRFILDPIDGTRAFLRDLPTWSTLLGIEWEGRMVAGIAFLPAADELFVGAEGRGATLNGRPCRLSESTSLKEASLALGAPEQFAGANLDALFFEATRRCETARSFGDFAGFAHLLRGSADLVIEPRVQMYDVAAAAGIIRAAGGRFTRFDGGESLEPGNFIACSAGLHPAVLELVAAYR